MKSVIPAKIVKGIGQLLLIASLLLVWPCLGLAEPLAISGPEAPANGQGYSASGGCPPYHWSISKGTISAGGVVTVAGQCGNARVAVTDACGGSASKEVRMPGGKWVLIGDYTGTCEVDGYSYGTGCGDHWAYDTVKKVTYCANAPYYTTCEQVRGTTKSVTTWGTVVVDGDWRLGTSDIFAPHTFTDAAGPLAECGCAASGSIKRPFAWKNKVYEWRCVGEENCVDSDNDGAYAQASNCPTGNDCIDNDPAIYPAAPELCDGRDNNCNQQVDEGASCDADGDGVPNGDDQCAGTETGVVVDAQGCPVPACSDNDGDGYAQEGGLCGPIDLCDTCPLVGDTLPLAEPYAFNPGDGESTTWPDGTTETGRDGHDKVNDPGTIADATKGTAKATSSPEQCNTSRMISSSVKLTSGALRDDVSLFATAGTGLTTSLTLYYDSLSPYNGPLGIGWSHSYDWLVKENAFGEVILKDGRGRRWLYEPMGGGYASQPGDSSLLEKTADGTYLLTHQDGTRYMFGANRRPAAITDRNGKTMTFAYEGDDLTEIKDANQRVTRLDYDGQGKLTAITDPAGNAYGITVTNDMLTEVLFPDGGSWRYGYIDHGFLSTKIDPAGHLVTYAYDEKHRLIQNVAADGGVREIVCPQTSDTVRTTTFTDKDGATWLYTFDVHAGELTAKTDPEGNVTSYSYDANHNLTAKTEPGIGTTSYSYDAQGNMTASTDPAGSTTEYTYNAFGQVTSVTDAADATTTYEYDERGNLIRVTAPDGGSTSYQYDEQGRLTGMTTATGETTVLSYDAQGNVNSATGPDGQTTTFTYDASGRRTATTDADGHVTRFEYDVRGHLIEVTDAKGNVTRYAYDAKGNRTKVIDANGHVTTFTYNVEGQMVSMTDALGSTTTFAYGGSAGCSSCGGGVDKLTSLTDAKGQATRFQYDPLGRLIQETDPLNHVTTYGYDVAGRVTAKTDPNGQTIHYGYDPFGRLTAKTYPDGTQATFSYDAKGNLLTAANADIAYSFSYDAGNRLTTVADSFGHQIDYTYDAAGKRTNMSSNSGAEINYAYDAAGRLEGIDSPAGNFTFDYDALGRRSQLAFPNGVTTTYTYDDLGRLTDLVSAKGSTLIAENHYTHDQVGNRLSNRDARATMSYGYDAIYRLTEAVSNAPGFSGNTKNSGKGTANATQNQKEIYIYDPVGNRLQTDKVRSTTHNAGNELLTADGTRYEYDATGNRTSKITSGGTTTYTWDAENRLMQVTLPDGKIVTFAYDPFGRRFAKTVDGITTRFTYDGEDILFETVNGSVGNVYIHGPGIDEPLALLDSKGPAYYHADGLGSIVALTDSNAKVAQRYEYDSFGNRKDMQNTIKQPYTYTGREHDRETGLYYYRARYSDAIEGRFISKDPISFLGGSTNLYSYVGNNSVNYVDPSGLFMRGTRQDDSIHVRDRLSGVKIPSPTTSGTDSDDCNKQQDVTQNSLPSWLMPDGKEALFIEGVALSGLGTELTLTGIVIMAESASGGPFGIPGVIGGGVVTSIGLGITTIGGGMIYLGR